MCGGPRERYRHGCSLGVALASAVDDMQGGSTRRREHAKVHLSWDKGAL